MRKGIKTTQILDFDTGESKDDTFSIKKQFQKRLYEIDNPYIGNKRKIVFDIAVALDKHGVKFNSMLDLFSGSAFVSLYFKLLGKRIVSNDLLTSSYHNALAFVCNNDVHLTDEDISFLCKNNNPGKGDFIQKRFTDRFSLEESTFLDNYRANIDVLTERYTGETSLLKRASAFVLIENYVMGRCFLGGRLNKGQILAKREHRIGHSRNRTLLGEGKMAFRLKPLPVFPSLCEHSAFNLDAEEFLNKAPVTDIDLLYLDPPYGGSQSDYAQMMAFPEEYVHKMPLEDAINLKNAKKFCTNKEYEANFRSILEHCKRFPNWAISYNDSSWADAEKIKGILSDYKKHIIVVNMDYEYKYRKENNTKATEYLFIAK